MKLSEVVNKVIEISDKVREYYDTELPKAHRRYPIVEPGEKEPPPPPEEAELQEFLKSLPEETIYKLLVLLDYGWNRVNLDNMADYYQKLKGEYGEYREYAIPLVMRKAVAGELAYSQEELEAKKIDVDQIPFEKVKMHSS